MFTSKYGLCHISQEITALGACRALDRRGANLEPSDVVEHRPGRDLRVQTPDLEGGARCEF